MLERIPVTIANIYNTNTQQVGFFQQTLLKLSDFAKGMIILGGDFNAPLSPTLDSSTGTASLSYRALSQIKLQQSTLNLQGILHPADKDYTFYSTPHYKYSQNRLRYIFISQQDIPRLHSVTIEAMILSDHHPVTTSLCFRKPTHNTKICRLDPTLLSDKVVLQTVQTKL